MASDLDSGFLRQRRNLLMISIALLLFELADGDLRGVSMVAPVTFEKEWVVLAFGWIAFFYLWGRYRIRSKGMWGKIKHDWIVSVQEDKGYRELVAELGGEHVPQNYRSNARPFIWRDWRSRNFDYSMNLDGGAHADTSPDAIRSAPYWRVLAVECRGIFSAIFHQASVTDYVLPEIIAGATLVIGIGLNADSILGWVYAFSHSGG